MSYRLEKSTGLCIEAELYDRLNVCRFTNKARTGLLGHGSASQIKHEVASLLQEQGRTFIWKTVICTRDVVAYLLKGDCFIRQVVC